MPTTWNRFERGSAVAPVAAPGVAQNIDALGIA
jgi:hypothetical protein